MRKQIYIEGQEIVVSKRTNLFEIKDWFQKGIIDYIHSSICSRNQCYLFVIIIGPSSYVSIRSSCAAKQM